MDHSNQNQNHADLDPPQLDDDELELIRRNPFHANFVPRPLKYY